MQVPLQVTFRNVRKDPTIEKLIESQAGKLDRVCDHLISCRVAIEQRQKHQTSGNPFRVRIDVTVPPEHELVVVREVGEGDLHEPLSTVTRDAFHAMRRQLKKLVDKQHGDVKKHPDQEVSGLVSRMFRERGYGFIKAPDGQEIYFHRNSVVGNQFDTIEVGTGVQWHQEDGAEGPQASSVRVLDKPG